MSTSEYRYNPSLYMYVFINYCRINVEMTMEITEMERRRKPEDKASQ